MNDINNNNDNNKKENYIYAINITNQNPSLKMVD